MLTMYKTLSIYLFCHPLRDIYVKDQ